jgi:hypothetical protein
VAWRWSWSTIGSWSCCFAARLLLLLVSDGLLVGSRSASRVLLLLVVGRAAGRRPGGVKSAGGRVTSGPSCCMGREPTNLGVGRGHSRGKFGAVTIFVVNMH